jgi:peptidoglycan/xylan/chitin deacetylase (PgdA/CDA1 family)
MYHNNATKTRRKAYFESINTAQELIQSTYFRPPYGRLQPNRSRQLAKEYKIIMWSWLSYDFDLSISIKEILQNAEKNIQRGDIIVLHDNPKISERQKELLPQLIQSIKDKGLTFGKLR